MQKSKTEKTEKVLGTLEDGQWLNKIAREARRDEGDRSAGATHTFSSSLFVPVISFSPAEPPSPGCALLGSHRPLRGRAQSMVECSNLELVKL